MEKLKRKRTINRKAGSHDLSYATTASALYQTRHGELTHISGHTFLAIRSVGATGYLGAERFLHSDVAYRDYRCCSVYECKRGLFVSIVLITTRVLNPHTGKSRFERGGGIA